MYIHVKVIPGAKKESFEKIKDLHYSARVKEPAERNLANKRVCELVAKEFKIKPSQVRLTSGHQSPSKLFSLPD